MKKVVVLLTILGLILVSSLLFAENEDSACKETAKSILNACQLKASADYWVTKAKCLNLASDEQKEQCIENALDEMDSTMDDCLSQYDARETACEYLQEDKYSVSINPSNFSPNITNQYFPLTPGTTYIYHGIDEDGNSFEDKVEVLNETTTINGVECRVVRDTVSQDGVILELTYDFYAQDSEGNVWYFGEDSRELNENGWITSIEGAWYTGFKYAQPGIIMKANPTPGTAYRQEYDPGNAEDMGYIISTNNRISVQYGDYNNCLKTLDWSPMEPDVIEYKYYAPGIGFIKSVANTGETVELVSITNSNQ